jgi:hypothetical protein
MCRLWSTYCLILSEVHFLSLVDESHTLTNVRILLKPNTVRLTLQGSGVCKRVSISRPVF